MHKTWDTIIPLDKKTYHAWMALARKNVTPRMFPLTQLRLPDCHALEYEEGRAHEGPASHETMGTGSAGHQSSGTVLNHTRKAWVNVPRRSRRNGAATDCVTK